MPGSRLVERRRKGWVKKTCEERLEELKECKKVLFPRRILLLDTGCMISVNNTGFLMKRSKLP